MKTVLALDDSARIRELVCFVLENAGYKVMLAEDGICGLEQLQKLKPDIILTDINMPRLDGLGFIEQARQTDNGRGTPILVLATESDGANKAHAKAAGATGWIVKPFNPNRLIDAVRRVTF